MPTQQNKINKIKIGSGDPLLIEDASAIHNGDLKTINGDSLEGSSDISLPNTAITATEINNAFEGGNN